VGDCHHRFVIRRVIYFLGLMAGLFFPAISHAQPNRALSNRQTCGLSLHHFQIIGRYPHDRKAFTQGLVFYQGELYESTGLHGQSSVRRLDVKSGRVLDKRRLDKTLFGEGLTVLDRQLVQLTWKSGQALLYTPSNLRQVGRFTYKGEGWGGTVIDKQLVISDGSSRLKFFNPRTFQLINSLEVTDHGRPVNGLNELEAVQGLIYANVYPGDCIARIDAHSGRVIDWLDLGDLMPLALRTGSSAVTNGIAYNSRTRTLFVTGKFWPWLYQLKLMENKSPDTQRAGHDNAGLRL